MYICNHWSNSNFCIKLKCHFKIAQPATVSLIIDNKEQCICLVFVYITCIQLINEYYSFLFQVINAYFLLFNLV